MTPTTAPISLSSLEGTIVEISKDAYSLSGLWKRTDEILEGMSSVPLETRVPEAHLRFIVDWAESAVGDQRILDLKEGRDSWKIMKDSEIVAFQSILHQQNFAFYKDLLRYSHLLEFDLLKRLAANYLALPLVGKSPQQILKHLRLTGASIPVFEEK